MAVTDSPHGTPSEGAQHHPPKRSEKSFVKKNKGKLIIGGAVGVLLLLTSKGKKTAATDPNAQLAADSQAQRNAIAAEQAANILPAGAPAEPTGAGGSAAGGGSPSGTTTDAPQDGTAGSPSPGAVAAPTGETNTVIVQQPGTRPAPAPKKPQSKKHPTTSKPAHGTGGNGHTAHGRHFPGATGAHTTHGAAGAKHVTVHYPGRTETHTQHPSGAWTDHTPGRNPPSRGVPVRSTPSRQPVPHHPAPPAHKAAPPAHHGPARPPVRRSGFTG